MDADDGVYSVSGCIARPFFDWIGTFWTHNGWWLFDAPAVIEGIARSAGATLAGTTLFYCEVHDREFDEDSSSWYAIEPDHDFPTAVTVPSGRRLEGFDVVSCSGREPSHSPLSCNGVERRVATNAHCLFPTFEDAVAALERGVFSVESEPGPFRVFAVYTIIDVAWPPAP